MVKDDGEKVTVALSWKASPGDFHCQWKLDRIRSATILWITLVEKKMGEEYWRIVRMMGHDDNVLNSHGSNPYTWGQSYGEAQFAMERGWKRLLYFHVSFAEATLRKPGLNNDCFSQTGYFGFFFQGSVICGVLELRSTWHLFVSWRQPKIPTGGGVRPVFLGVSVATLRYGTLEQGKDTHDWRWDARLLGAQTTGFLKVCGT